MIKWRELFYHKLGPANLQECNRWTIWLARNCLGPTQRNGAAITSAQACGASEVRLMHAFFFLLTVSLVDLFQLQSLFGVDKRSFQHLHYSPA